MVCHLFEPAEEWGDEVALPHLPKQSHGTWKGKPFKVWRVQLETIIFWCLWFYVCFWGCISDYIWAKPTWILEWSSCIWCISPAAYLGLDLPSNPQKKRVNFRPGRLLNGVRCWTKDEALSVQRQWIALVVHTSNWGLSPDAHAFLQNSLWANWSMIGLQQNLAGPQHNWVTKPFKFVICRWWIFWRSSKSNITTYTNKLTCTYQNL